MPYVNEESRKRLASEGAFPNPKSVGELTYILYGTVLDYAGRRQPKYDVHAEVIAALENAKLEYYRRKVALYEDKKLEENGDV